MKSSFLHGTKHTSLALFFYLMLLGNLLSAQDYCNFQEWTTTKGVIDRTTDNTDLLPEQLDGLQIKLGQQKQFIDDQDNIYMTMPEFEAASEIYKMLIRRVNASGEEVWSNIYEIPESNGNVIPTAIKMDKDGNLLIAGTYLVTAPINYNGFLIKINSLGEVVWLKSFAESANGFNGWLDIDTDDSGNIYLAGATTTQGLTPDFTVMSLDTNGQQLWSKQLDQAGLIDFAAKIEYLNGVIFATGITQQNANTYGLLTTSYTATNGVTLFETPIFTNNNELHTIEKLITDADNEAIYVVGTITKTTGSDFYVAKINMFTGLILWQSQNPTSGLGDAQARSAAHDDSGNIFITGYMKAQNTGRDFAIVKYNPLGFKLWTKFYDGNGFNDEAYDITLDDTGNIYITGYGIEQPNNKDFLTIKTDNDGNEIWRRYYNGIHNGEDIAKTIRLDNTGGVIVGGPTDEGELIRHTMLKYGDKCTVTLPKETPFSSAIAFIENRGQLQNTDGEEVEEIKYKSDRINPTHYFFKDKISLVQVNDDGDETTPVQRQRVDMLFNSPTNRNTNIFPLERRTDYYNYYLGHIPEGRERVPLFKNIVHRNAFPNIDIQYAGKGRNMSYSFVIKSGANPSDIQLNFQGQNGISINNQGKLVISTSLNPIVLPSPTAYQLDASGNMILLNWEPHYTIMADNNVGFILDEFNEEMELIIEIKSVTANVECEAEPEGIEYSTYYGGSERDRATDITTGEVTIGSPNVNATGGDIYITGQTSSEDFPAEIGGLIEELQGSGDAFVISMNDLARQWVTHFGGNTSVSGDNGGTGSNSIIYDIGNEAIYFAGQTNCVDLPVTAEDENPIDDYIGDPPSSSGLKSYISKLNIFGQKEYSTYFGGSNGNNEIMDLGLNNFGSLFIVGHTSSSQSFDLEDNNGVFYQDSNGDGQAFIAEFDNVSRLIWSTKFSGNGASLRDLAVDNDGNLIVVGDVQQNAAISTDFVNQPGVNDFFSTTSEGLQEAFIAKFEIKENSRDLIWSTLFAGNDTDYGFEVGVNSKNEIFMVGATRSTPNSFPLLNSIDNINEEGDMFISKFSSNGVLQFSTFYGGSEADIFNSLNQFIIPINDPIGIAFDQNDNFYITSQTSSPDFDLEELNGTYFQNTLGNDNTPDHADAFILVFDKNLQRQWSTYLGGRSGTPGDPFTSNSEEGTGVVVVGNKLYVVGATHSTCPRNFPVMNADNTNYYQEELLGSLDAFITVFTIDDLVSTEEEDNIVKDNRLKVFPSPAKENIIVQFDTSITLPVEVNLYNIWGQLVWNTKTPLAKGKQIIIPTNNLYSGTYLVSLLTKDHNFTKKVVIQK